jgi:hypothetical protein
MAAKAKLLPPPDYGLSPLGRPPEYLPTYPHMAFEFCLLGATNQKLASLFSVTRQTIDNWIAKIPEFKAAVHAGREGADAKVATALYNRAIGYRHPEEKLFYDSQTGEVVRTDTVKQYAPDAGAALKWLHLRTQRNRDVENFEHAWDDTAKVELSGPGGQPLAAPVINILPVRASTAGD